MRTKERCRSVGEVFTPRPLVEELLDKIREEKFTANDTTFLDQSCGNGAFLIPVYDKLRSYGHSHENALSRVHGVDIMLDNCVETIVRLHNEEFRQVSDSSEAIREAMLNVEFMGADGEWHKFTDAHREQQIQASAFRYKGVVNYNIVAHDGLTYHYNFDGTLSEKVVEQVKTVKKQEPKKKPVKKLSHKHREKKPQTTLSDLFD